MAQSLGLTLYNTLARQYGAFQRRRLKLQGDATRIQERLGTPKEERPDTPLIWCHVTTKTQADAFFETINRIREDGDEFWFLLTSDSSDLDGFLKQHLPKQCFHLFLPLSAPQFIRPYLDHWKPDAVVWTESASHPLLLSEIVARNIPLFLTDANIPAVKPSLFHRILGLEKWLYKQFNAILAREEETAEWLKDQGVETEKIEFFGPMQEGTVALACCEGERARLAESLLTRPIWLAAGCSENEEAIVVGAHKTAMRRAHRLLLIVVPELPERGAMLVQAAEAAGLNTCLRSGGEDPDENTQVYVADTEGEMGLWYRLAPTTFMGGTLEPNAKPGGASPYDPAALGSAILHGPELGPFADSYARLGEAGATEFVEDRKTLATAVETLLAPDKAAIMAHNAWAVSSGGSLVTGRIIELLTNVLDAPRAG